jgi:hypothetical protein
VRPGDHTYGTSIRFQKDWKEIAEDFRPKFEKDLRKIPD